MTTKDKVARRKLSLLELATDLGNVSKACKLMGYSRQQFYEIRRNFQTYGAEGLIDRMPGAKRPASQSRLRAEIEKAVLDYALGASLPWRAARRAGNCALQRRAGLLRRRARRLACAMQSPDQA